MTKKELGCGRCRTLLRVAINKNEDTEIQCDMCSQKMRVTWAENGDLHIHPILPPEKITIDCKIDKGGESNERPDSNERDSNAG